MNKSTFKFWNTVESGTYSRYINFRVFRANSASANSKTRENICRYFVCYINWTRRSCVWTICVDANGLYTKVCLRPALFLFCPVVYIHVNVFIELMLTLCSTKMTSEHLLSANLTNPRIYFLGCQTRKFSHAKITAFTVLTNTFNRNTKSQLVLWNWVQTFIWTGIKIKILLRIVYRQKYKDLT